MRAGLFAALLVLNGCGLSPVYALKAGSDRHNQAVSIQIEGGHPASAYTLQQAMARALALGVPSDHAGRATLKIRLNEGFERLAYERDRSVSRTLYHVSADWQYLGKDGTLVWSGRNRVETGFDAKNGAQSDIEAQSDARLRATQILALRIRNHLLASAIP